MHYELILLGTILIIIGTVVAPAPQPQQDIRQLGKERQLLIVDDMLKGQEAMDKALRRMYRQVDASNAIPSASADQNNDDSANNDGDLGDPDAVGYSKEEEAYDQMKLQKIREARRQLEGCVQRVASNFIEMNSLVGKIDDKVNGAIRDGQDNVNYNLFYYPNGKPSQNHGAYQAKNSIRRHVRGSRELKLENAEEPQVEESSVLEETGDALPEMVSIAESE